MGSITSLVPTPHITFANSKEGGLCPPPLNEALYKVCMCTVVVLHTASNQNSRVGRSENEAPLWGSNVQ